MKKTITLFTTLCIVLTLAGCAKKEGTKKNVKEPVQNTTQENLSAGWMDVQSLKAVYVDSGIFDHIGFAIPAANLGRNNILEGVVYHANSITLENEAKPDTIMRNFARGGLTETDFETFTSSKKVSIQVPLITRLNFDSIDKTLATCRDNGLKMRGHVLVWHSQTPKSFFCQDFNPSKPLVSEKEMDARQEWYIKSVFNHVQEWENQNNEGNHIIYAWDVVNEALSDNATAENFLRGADSSNWFAIYQNGDFIVNAFRYANKYAPKDVLLAYNDYNEFQGARHTGYLAILDSILAAKNDKNLPSRIDIAGMQSHNQTAWPSLPEYEKCIQDFIAKGLDIHVTELDITGSWKSGNNFDAANPEAQRKTYNDYFKLYQKYRKTDSTNGVTGITLWGITDEYSWRKNGKPLLFSNYRIKPAYEGVIQAAENSN